MGLMIPHEDAPTPQTGGRGRGSEAERGAERCVKAAERKPSATETGLAVSAEIRSYTTYRGASMASGRCRMVLQLARCVFSSQRQTGRDEG
jgi:hypothetical protein